jgi:hypothetical protein
MKWQAKWQERVSHLYGVYRASFTSGPDINVVFMGTIYGLVYYVLTGVVVLMGAVFGHRFLSESGNLDRNAALVSAFVTNDGTWYKQIVSNGYTYDPDHRSSVAFFPLYPLLSYVLSRITGLGHEVALLTVSHICLLMAFVLAFIYVKRRTQSVPGLAIHVLLSMGLMPATLFFRMTYSESLLLMLSILALLGMSYHWPLIFIGLIVGIATASRPVGVGLLAPYLLHCWHRFPTRREFLRKLGLVLPIGCCGLIGYMCFQAISFGDPVAFAKAQFHWGGAREWSFEKLYALLSGEPILNVYDTSSPAYWGKTETYPRNPLFNWDAVNPVYFVLTVILVILGGYKRWLSCYEIALGVALLGIPYFTRAYDMGMVSQARYAAVVFPAYLVIANLLIRLPNGLQSVLLSITALYMGMFTALFAAGYLVY